MSEDTKVEETKKQPKPEAPKLEGKLGEFVDYIETISVLELSQLVKALEDRLGVSAAAPMMAMAPAAGGGGGDESAAAEKTEFDVILKSPGGQKISVIKEVRAITALGLKEAKELVESCPKPVKEGVSKDEAEALKKQLEGTGAEAEIK